jgi:hypothetical protein
VQGANHQPRRDSDVDEEDGGPGNPIPTSARKPAATSSAASGSSRPRRAPREMSMGLSVSPILPGGDAGRSGHRDDDRGEHAYPRHDDPRSGAGHGIDGDEDADRRRHPDDPPVMSRHRGLAAGLARAQDSGASPLTESHHHHHRHLTAGGAGSSSSVSMSPAHRSGGGGGGGLVDESPDPRFERVLGEFEAVRRLGEQTEARLQAVEASRANAAAEASGTMARAIDAYAAAVADVRERLALAEARRDEREEAISRRIDRIVERGVALTRPFSWGQWAVILGWPILASYIVSDRMLRPRGRGD